MKRLLALGLVLAAAGSCGQRHGQEREAARTQLYLITPLPLLFGDGFDVAFIRPPVTESLERRYSLQPVDLPSQVPAGATLLMAQPRALPAEELVALDRWVRDGGGLLLLADPRLEWPSRRPLGDKLRPPVMFADTGLLNHWGLRLDAPEMAGTVHQGDVTYISPGRLVTDGPCKVSGEGLVAYCRIGRGEVAIVADADWLNDGLVARSGGDFPAQARALDALLERIAS